MAPRPLLRETPACPIGTLVIPTDAEGWLRVAGFDDGADRTRQRLDRADGRGGWAVRETRHTAITDAPGDPFGFAPPVPRPGGFG